jgi:plastocyanin
MADYGHVRLSWLVAAGLLSLAGNSLVPGAIDVHGTTQAGLRPEPQTVVWLDAPDRLPAGPPTKAVLDQRNIDFSPHILVVRVGTIIEFPNNDRVFHNVFSFHDGKRFDLGLYPVGTSKRIVVDHAGLSRIFCNIHPNMAAHIMAVDTGYYALSDENGRFTIANLPAGTYTYHAWRPGRSELAGTFTTGTPTLAIQWP